MENFRKIERMGEGTFGAVYKVMDKRNGKYYALKVCLAKQDQLPNLFTEALIMYQADHRNVVFCHEILLDKNKILLKLELCTMDLHTLMCKYPKFGENNIILCITSILRGLKYLHDKSVVHCDLKPNNILFKQDEHGGVIKVADFNSAQFTTAEDSEAIHETPGATRWYRAPECILEHKYTPGADIWSVGCIMYELFTGDVLFVGKNSKEQLELILGRFGIPSDYRICAEYIIDKRLKLQNKPKFFSREIKKGKFGEQAADLMRRMLCINPEYRISVEDALEHPYLNDE